ncbi:FAD/NAD(P)-binding protein [Streptomyces sp. NRRL F-2580]|uniref:FAD/NAD(P)-binding protein n=1 Tax=Streptomyces sp. NRRL F-2580 TaxID=1463841 RepID=UPI00099B660C|nr:FAD/NAD(P)-binding protein [Streptomyces sp. NRRL F-2580]
MSESGIHGEVGGVAGREGGLARIRLAIVGGGPYCTYAMERLAASVTSRDGSVELDIHVFDRTGHFGAGAVHSDAQAPTSFLNRIARHVSFGADESVEDAGPLLPAELRPNLYDWCRRKFEGTGDPRFDIDPDSWPKRYLHGLALREHFSEYVEILRSQPSVTVTLHHSEVTDIEDLAEKGEEGTLLVTSAPVGDVRNGAVTRTAVDQVLLLTGHSYNDPMRSERTRQWVESAARTPGSVFVPSAYPLRERLTTENAGPGRVVGCAGTMLTGIDVILHLTEGRGGLFQRAATGELRYVPSGHEPRSIVAFSESGLFAFARPHESGSSGAKKKKRKGIFLTVESVDRLRENFGSDPVRVGRSVSRQIDYERHLFPLIVAEMWLLYYETLFGEDFGGHLAEATAAARRDFLDRTAETAPTEESVRMLTAPIERAVAEAVDALESFLLGRSPYVSLRAEVRPWCFDTLLWRYVDVVLGQSARERLEAALDDPAEVASIVAGLESPSRHAVLPSGNLFSWERTLEPIAPSDQTSPEQYRKAMVEFMTVDHVWARQGTFTNPAKTAADGVWRGLRPAIVHAVNFGGLHADAHRTFLGSWLRQHNRLAYGPVPEVMERIQALIEHGILDVSPGPLARVETDGDTLVVRGPRTGAVRPIDVLVDGRVPSFDASADIAPLYPNLLRRGLVRVWRNPHTGGGEAFEPGGLDLTEDFRVIRPDGSVDDRISVLGPAIEGQRFFQGGAMKPDANHHAMRNVLCWLRTFWKQTTAA